MSAGRYNSLSRSDLTGRVNPINSSVNNAFRSWTDVNGNYTPDCDVRNLASQDLSASGGDICGPMSSAFFGQFNASAVTFDDSVLRNNREFLWDINVDLQHEIVHGLSLAVGYNHNWDGSFTVTENTLLGPGDFDEVLHHRPDRFTPGHLRPDAMWLLRCKANAVRSGHAAGDQREGLCWQERQHGFAEAVLGRDVDLRSTAGCRRA